MGRGLRASARRGAAPGGPGGGRAPSPGAARLPPATSCAGPSPSSRPPPPPRVPACAQGGGRGSQRVCEQEAAATPNSSLGARVCVCVSRGERAGPSRAAANRCAPGAEPSAPPSRRPPELRAEAIHAFGDVIPGVGERGRGLSGPSPAPAPINTAAPALCGTASSGEWGAPSANRRFWPRGRLGKADPRRLYPRSAPVSSSLGTQ